VPMYKLAATLLSCANVLCFALYILWHPFQQFTYRNNTWQKFLYYPIPKCSPFNFHTN